MEPDKRKLHFRPSTGYLKIPLPFDRAITFAKMKLFSYHYIRRGMEIDIQTTFFTLSYPFGVIMNSFSLVPNFECVTKIVEFRYVFNQYF